jgi:hypothetical protein
MGLIPNFLIGPFPRLGIARTARTHQHSQGLPGLDVARREVCDEEAESRHR